jgi:hypothetical protein
MAYCLAFLADRYVPLDLMVEGVFMSVASGKLTAHEVYDIVFRLNTAWKDARILAVSPHCLAENGGLRARVSVTPGAGGQDDVFFSDMVLYNTSYHESTQEVHLTLPAHGNPLQTGTTKYSGKVIEPTLAIPRSIAQSPAACQIMTEFGTVFELNCGDLEADRPYAIRLVLDPLQLLALPDRRPLDVKEIDEIVSRWVQHATIICPKTCHFNWVKLAAGTKHNLELARQDPNISVSDLDAAIEGVARILGVVTDEALRLMPIRRHQIVLVVPNRSELVAKTPDGYVWFTDSYELKDGRIAAVWEAGSDQFWRDDPEMTARVLCDYFQKYANVKECAKTKEEASEAINAAHDVCSLIIDGLHNKGALLEMGGGRYIAANKSEQQTIELCQAVAASSKISTDFKWKGFQIRYSLQYRDLSEEDAVLLKKLRWRRDWSYYLAVLGIVLALLSMVVSIVTLVW